MVRENSNAFAMVFLLYWFLIDIVKLYLLCF